jgi:hypothetical protein
VPSFSYDECWFCFYLFKEKAGKLNLSLTLGTVEFLNSFNLRQTEQGAEIVKALHRLFKRATYSFLLNCCCFDSYWPFMKMRSALEIYWNDAFIRQSFSGFLTSPPKVPRKSLENCAGSQRIQT